MSVAVGLWCMAAQSAQSLELRFEDRLVRAIDAEAQQPNLVFSPYSVVEALSMLSAGSSGTTKTQIQAAMAGSSPDRRKVRADLTAVNLANVGVSVAVANALWTAQDLRIEASFQSLLRREFNASASPLPFRTDASGSARTINRWISRSTDGRIPQLVDAGTLNNQTRVVITNSVLFRGEWLNPFDPAKTALRPFTLADGRRIQTKTMRGTATTVNTPNGTMVVLPYTSDYEMHVLVPSVPRPLDLSAALATLQSRDPNAERCVNVAIELPKWSASVRLDLKSPLQSIGISNAFGTNADFSAMTRSRPGSIQVTNVVHAANIDVNEQGTIASAATAVIAEATETAPNSASCPTTVAVDRPFAYVIRHQGTGQVLFAGRVAQPTN